MGYMHQRLLSAGKETHARIIRRSILMASKRGLQGITFGRLARSLNMSKSGIFVYFGSKEELQVEALEAVWKRFNRHIGWECMDCEPGVSKLCAMTKGWLHFLSRRRTGGLFLSVGMEFDDLEGRVHDTIMTFARNWALRLEQEIEAGIQRKEVKDRVTPRALAFELQGIAHHGIWADRLLRHEDAWVCAKRRINRAIHRACTGEGRVVISEYLLLSRGIPVPRRQSPSQPPPTQLPPPHGGSDGESTL